MNLKEIVENIIKRRENDSSDAIEAIAEAEKYLQQAYQGRCFFELYELNRWSSVEYKVSISANLLAQELLLSEIHYELKSIIDAIEKKSRLT